VWTSGGDIAAVDTLRRYSPTKLCDGAQMAIFDDFLRPIFSASRVQHIRTTATPCVQVWQTSNLRRLRLGEEKKKKEEQMTG